tara:strand:- start:78 stop:326 length:249 start_codon:yes stop_codon:yes gene_type:complete
MICNLGAAYIATAVIEQAITDYKLLSKVKNKSIKKDSVVHYTQTEIRLITEFFECGAADVYLEIIQSNLTGIDILNHLRNRK